MKIAVTAPTGNIGRVLTERLLDAGAEVTLLARNPEKVKGFTDRGATVIPGSLDDAEYVKEATRGADCLFWLTPPDYAAADFMAYQKKLGGIVAEAVKANGIPRVVHLSSLGAQRPSGTGPVAGLHAIEEMLNAVAENVTHLRPGMFMENHLGHLETIKSAKSVFVPLPGEKRARFIATRDIGEFAARRALDESWTGRHEMELHGPENLSFDEAAAAISEALGETVAHVPVQLEQAREAMVGMGLSAATAQTMTELYDGIGKGLLEATQPVGAANSGKTTFAEFAREILAPAVRGSSPVS